MFTVAQIANRYKHIPCRELCISVVSSRRGRYETAKIPIQVEVFAVFCIWLNNMKTWWTNKKNMTARLSMASQSWTETATRGFSSGRVRKPPHQFPWRYTKHTDIVFNKTEPVAGRHRQTAGTEKENTHLLPFKNMVRFERLKIFVTRNSFPRSRLDVSCDLSKRKEYSTYCITSHHALHIRATEFIYSNSFAQSQYIFEVYMKMCNSECQTGRFVWWEEGEGRREERSSRLVASP
jgi:hypothetical protein